MLVSSIMSVFHRIRFNNLQFLRFQSVSSLASDLTPFYYSEDSDSDSNSKNNVFTKNYNKHEELNSFSVVELLQSMQNEPLSALSLFNQLKDHGFQHVLETYTAIIKILCCRGGFHMKLNPLILEVIVHSKSEHSGFQVWEFTEAMVEGLKDLGQTPLARFFDALIKGYTNLGMFDDAIGAIFDIRARGLGVCYFPVNYLMNKLIEHGKLDKVDVIYKKFEWLKLRPNVYTYTIVIKAYCRKGSMEEASNILLEMKRNGVEPDAFTYTPFLEEFSRQGHTVLAYDRLRSLEREENVQVDAYMYSCVIRGFVNEKKLKEAEDVLHDMEKQRLVPTEFEYRFLIQGYCDLGDINKAAYLHNQMERKGIKTNCSIVTSIIQSLCVQGFPSESVSQFHNFLESGTYLDEIAYNVAIDALCKMNELDKALRLFDDMESKNLVPDVVHYTTLINGFFLHRNCFGAVNLLQKMGEKGFKPDLVNYNVLAGGLARNGLSEEVFIILDNMKGRGLSPTEATHNSILEGLLFCGKFEKAEEYLSDLRDLILKSCAGATVIDRYCEYRESIRAYKIFLKLVKEKVPVNRSCCFKLLDSLLFEREYCKAVVLFKKMLLVGEEGPSKEMFENLISALCRAQRLDMARRAFDHMFKRGLLPDVITYTIMLHGYYFQKDGLQKRLSLFSDMKEKGVVPDVITYTVLLSRHFERTLWREMKEMDLRPDVICFRAVIESLCKSDNLEDATFVLNEMIEQGLVGALVCCYYKKGEMDKAVILGVELPCKGVESAVCRLSQILRVVVKDECGMFGSRCPQRKTMRKIF